jgi:hypothetical protein
MNPRNHYEVLGVAQSAKIDVEPTTGQAFCDPVFCRTRVKTLGAAGVIYLGCLP